ncbi:YadA C-terminal domain-containing protein [secondary endosymbiont of Ctenarytaina eucalypti]|uniref:Hemagglutinin-like protein n=1 Tax=secondary endosymbiont of Ctenarytaina eucalypti TaxID=1199245 RepID=J3YS17_9ENTR|nr:YadA-like family protein [secondary endosymbiont of Ctenarytaina eucalypti]AFP84908.1 hemagglutinin-like protein [secondary endosymbiont of Ctenarytaina eucalypti]
MNKTEKKARLLNVPPVAYLASAMQTIHALKTALTDHVFIQNKRLSVNNIFTSKVILVKNKKIKTAPLSKEKIIDKLLQKNRHSLLKKDLKSAFHLCNNTHTAIISERKRVLSKIKFLPETVFSYAIISTLTALPYTAIADEITHSGTGKNAYVMGEDTEASASETTAIGHGAKAYQEHSTALGSHASTTRKYVSFLNEKIANEMPNRGLYYNSDASAQIDNRFAEVSVGGTYEDDTNDELFYRKYAQITHVASGTEETDAVNLYQLNTLKESIDKRIGTVNSTVNSLDRKFTLAEQEKKERAQRSASDANAYKNTDTASKKDIKTVAAQEDEDSHTNLYYTAANKAALAAVAQEDAHPTSMLSKASRKNLKISKNTSHTMHMGAGLEEKYHAVAGTSGEIASTSVANTTEDNHPPVNHVQLNRIRRTARSAYTMGQNNTPRINRLEQQVSKTNTKIDRGLAASAALAGLFQPYCVGKANVTAGLGGYRSSQALAVGSGYRMNENAAVKIGLAYSGGNDIMYNASFNLEW